MGRVNVRKRGKVYQFQFEIARVNGKRKTKVALKQKLKQKQNTKKQIDKIDKTISHEEESDYQSNKKKKRHTLTKDIIKRKYIKNNDIEVSKYDKLFKELLETYDMDDIAIILHYVIKSVKGRNFKDENNKKIENKFGYLKKSILENIDKFKNNEIEWDEELGWLKDTTLFNNLNENEEEMDYNY